MTVERLRPHVKDLGGGLTVRRSLPAASRQSVGPFLFFDHFGPLLVEPEDQHDVRPHPHIGLATVTYLYEGAMVHRDSTGAVRRIDPGAINWMTAGRGIVHSERRPDDLAGRHYRLHGLQLWVALPEADEACEPAFDHTAAADIPQHETCGVTTRVLVGAAHGLVSPVRTASPTLFLDHRMEPRGRVDLPAREPGIEQAVYAADGEVELVFDDDGHTERVATGEMLVLPEGRSARLCSGAEPARVALIGGAPLGRRLLWWNFVATRRDLIDAAALAWTADTLGRVPGETERIPLPERKPG
ncbi:pirin family protein [Sphaerotilus mobilis]|uniref:Pirin n=1 Tax=Sphaerotilus mobilis TaxID=47994 RepID=A0A4Q7LB38_9BURK|nr:pirin family protein [Sphaerotilus mobilis]RZS46860.1 hypothetical protein EV685_3892 [Sphaerotilus mobilis]